MEGKRKYSGGINEFSEGYLQDTMFEASQGAFCLRCGAWRGSLGLEPTPELYVQHLVEIFREVRRVLRDDGTLWLNLGSSYWGGKGKSGYELPHEAEGRRARGETFQTAYNVPGYMDMRPADGKHPVFKPKDLVPIPWMVAMALQADGWWLRSDIIWAKSNPMPESVRDRPTKSHEYLFLLAKSKRYYYDADTIREPQKMASRLRVMRGWDGDTQRDYPNGPQSHIDKYFNKSREEAMSMPGRNKRTVWAIPTKPFKGAHFATFPPALVEPCILAGTSAKGQCPRCSKAWVRVVERTGVDNVANEVVPDYDVPGIVKGSSADRVRRLSGSTYQRVVQPTNNWQPACDCNAGGPIPQIVLDPFMGAGTTCMVADRLKRHWFGIDISEEYCEMARERIRSDRLGKKIPNGQTTIFDTLPFPV